MVQNNNTIPPSSTPRPPATAEPDPDPHPDPDPRPGPRPGYHLPISYWARKRRERGKRRMRGAVHLDDIYDETMHCYDSIDDMDEDPYGDMYMGKGVGGTKVTMKPGGMTVQTGPGPRPGTGTETDTEMEMEMGMGRKVVHFTETVTSKRRGPGGRTVVIQRTRQGDEHPPPRLRRTAAGGGRRAGRPGPPAWTNWPPWVWTDLIQGVRNVVLVLVLALVVSLFILLRGPRPS